MPGPFLVRKPASLATTTANGGVTGDGKGSENPVPVRGANQVVLLLDADDDGNSNDLEIFMEVSINGTDYYRETSLSVSSGTATVTKKKYAVDGDIIDDDGDRIAIALDVLAAFARFNFAISAAGTWGNVACRAITGRV